MKYDDVCKRTVRELVDDAEEIGRMYWELLELVKGA